MTNKIARYGLLTLLVCAGATVAMADAAVIADNHGKNAWDLSAWEQVTGQTLTLTQAPMLGAMDLPPLQQRLPDDPLVLLPTSQVKKIGTYQDLARIQGTDLRRSPATPRGSCADPPSTAGRSTCSCVPVRTWWRRTTTAPGP